MLHCVLLKNKQEKAVEKEATAKKVAQAAAAKKSKQTVKYEDLEMMRVLGAGTFGKVSLVRHRPVRLTKVPGCMIHYHPSSFSPVPPPLSLSGATLADQHAVCAEGAAKGQGGGVQADEERDEREERDGTSGPSLYPQACRHVAYHTPQRAAAAACLTRGTGHPACGLQIQGR